MAVKFEAGSYPWGEGFVRAIGRYSQSEGQWNSPDLLINISSSLATADEAAILAKSDIEIAHKKTLSSTKRLTIDHFLSLFGYQKLEESND